MCQDPQQARDRKSNVRAAPLTPIPERRAEGYRLVTETRAGHNIVWIIGADARGTLFGAGQLLRTAVLENRRVYLPKPVHLVSSAKPTSASASRQQSLTQSCSCLRNSSQRENRRKFSRSFRRVNRRMQTPRSIHTRRLSRSKWLKPKSNKSRIWPGRMDFR